jgi:RND family efflux transporter MFP subunit
VQSRKHETKRIENCPAKNLAARQTRPKETFAIHDTRKIQLANGGPDASPGHFCLRVQQESGNSSGVSAGGRSGHGGNARRPDIQRMGGDLGRVRQRPDPTPSLGLYRGQVLFEIDPRPFTAALDRTKGDLAQAQAQLGKATLDVERDTPLAEGKAIAKSQLDNEVQAKLGAQAAVESAKAAVEQAELNLEWTKVTSLVDGIAGIAQVQIGNLVGPSSNLTSVSQVDPIKAFFPINEHEYLIAQSKGNASSSEHTIRFFGTTVELLLADGRMYPQKGKVLLADRQVDPNTGTIRIVAAFPNPGNILRPGQYGRVRVQTSMKRDALLIPQSAVAQWQGSYQVAVVGNDHKVNIRTVRPGETVETMWVIDQGLKLGEQVAVGGLQQLREGTLVTPKPAHLSGEGN